MAQEALSNIYSLTSQRERKNPRLIPWFLPSVQLLFQSEVCLEFGVPQYYLWPWLAA